MSQGPEAAGNGGRVRRGPQRVDLRAGAGVQGAAASLAGVLPPAGAARQGVQDRRRGLAVVWGPEAAGAVTGFTVARSA